MSTLLSSALSEALRAGRTQINARVMEACRAQPGFDTAAIKTFLCGPLNQLIDAAARMDAARVNSLLMVALDVALNLQLRGKNEQASVQRVWSDVLPACLPHALQNPRETLACLFNAMLNLNAQHGARPEQWASEMIRLAKACPDLDHLRRVGQVLAWRCGTAHYRSGALAVLGALPHDLAKQIFCLAPEQDWSDIYQQLQGNPWFDPACPEQRGLRLIHQVGGFCGFGGPFSSPPQARVYAEGFLIHSAGRYWYLCADAFGAVLHAGSAEEFAAASSTRGALQQSGNVFSLGTQQCRLELPEQGLEMVCGAEGAVVCSPFSHSLRLLALS